MTLHKSGLTRQDNIKTGHKEMDIYRIYFLKGLSYEFCENDNIKTDHNEMDVYRIYF